MRGTFTFKPIKANLTHDTEWITKMDPYCSFTLGSQKFKTQICKSGGKNPVWNDQLSVPIDTDQQFCYLQIMDQDRLSKDDNIGTATIDLFEVMNNTNRFVSKWYPIFYKNKSAGEILIEIGFNPSGQGFGNQPFVSGTQNVGYGQSTLGTQGYSHNVPLTTGQTYTQTGLGTGNIGQTGYSQTSNISGTAYGGSQHIPLGTHGSLEDPLYGKTVDVKSAGVLGSTGYSGSNVTYEQGSNLGYGQGGSNLGYQQGSNLGYQQGSNLGYGQGGSNLGYQQGSNLGYQQGGTTLGQDIGRSAERLGQNISQGLNPNPNLNQNLGTNVGGQQFTQPGYH